jgi:hypothetical protein
VTWRTALAVMAVRARDAGASGGASETGADEPAVVPAASPA